MHSKKRFSVIFLILVLVSTVALFISCESATGGQSPITNIVVSTLPKTDYYLGDAFEIGNAEITVYYEDGSKETFPLEYDMISEFNSNTLGKQTLTVQYGDKKTFINVEVTTAPVFSLQIESAGHKTEYVVGDTFNTNELRILVTYSNGRTAVKNVTADMVSGFDSTTTGEKQVTISFGGRTCPMTINVVKKSVMEMQLIAPTKISYIVGETLDAAGLRDGRIFISYNNNTSEYKELPDLYLNNEIGILIANEETTTFTQSQSACNVTIYYEGKSFGYIINVKPVEVVSAKVIQDVKPQIFESETHDFSDGKIKVDYNNGKTAELSFTDERVYIDMRDFNINRLGVYSLAITIGELSFNYEVEVIGSQPCELIVTPNVSSIYQDEKIDITKWTYKVKLDNGKFHVVSNTGSTTANITADMFVGNLAEDIDTFTVGTHKYYFEYRPAYGTIITTSVDITVLRKEITKLELTIPEKTTYETRDALDLTGATVVATYVNGEVGNEINVTADMIGQIEVLSGTSGEGLTLETVTESARKARIYVDYTDARYESIAQTYFDVNIVKRALKMELLSTPKSKYILGEVFDSSDWTVTVHYDDVEKTTASFDGDFSGSEWSFENTDFSETGRYAVKLYYNNRKDIAIEYNCAVTNDITSWYLNIGHFGFITEGNDLNTDEVSAIIERENGSVEVIPITTEMTNYVANIEFKPVSQNTEFVPAYAKANLLAKYCFENGENFANRFFTLNNELYNVATEYTEGTDYYISLAQQYLATWETYKHNFYVKENDAFIKCNDEFDYNANYYVINNNQYFVTIEYADANPIAYPIVVTGKQIVSAVYEAPIMKYQLGDTDWNISAGTLKITFDNRTVANLPCSDLDYSATSHEYSFELNGMVYVFTIGRINQGTYEIYDFADFSNRLLTGDNIDVSDKYVVEEICFAIGDAVSGKEIYSSKFETYCFEQLIESIYLVIGKYENNDFISNSNQTVYVNEGQNLYNTNESATPKVAYVKIAGEKISFIDSAFVAIKYVGESQREYVSLNEAMLSGSYGMSGYNANKTGAQTVKLDYLLSSCTFSVEVYSNIVNAILAESDDVITIIEGMDISSEHIKIILSYVDNDGDAISETKQLDLSEAVLKVDGKIYDKQEIIDFGVNSYVERDLTLEYSGKTTSAGEIKLVIKKKRMTDVKMKTTPQQVYIEAKEGAESAELNLYSDNGTMGSVIVFYDNGTTETVNLDDSRITYDAVAFNTKLSLENGSEQSQTIYVYCVQGDIRLGTSYDIVVKDRKYLEIHYVKDDETAFSYQYGTSVDAAPQFDILYYSTFNGVPEALPEMSDGINGYTISYKNALGGDAFSEWPTLVGNYVMIIEYPGDEYNNVFVDNSRTIEITKRELTIKISPFANVYGDIIELERIADLGIEYEIKGFENGVTVDNPFKLGDTQEDVIESVDFIIHNSQNKEVKFSEYTINGVKKIVIDAPTWDTYYITAIVKLWDGDSNYYLSSNIGNVKAEYTVVPKDIVIVTNHKVKEYGQVDPLYDFEIYDFDTVLQYMLNNGIVEEGDEITEAIVSSVDYNQCKINKTLVPIGNQTAVYYYYNEEYSDIYNNGVFDTNNDKIIFTDKDIANYRMTRTSIENVGEYDIIRGPAEALYNYNVYFVGDTIEIIKASVTITATDIERYFGTMLANEVVNEDNIIEKIPVGIDYKLAAGSKLQNNDVFSDLFIGYFEYDNVFFYNLTTGVFTNRITDTYYDNWAILYKNIRIYKDKECTIEAWTYLENVSFTIGDSYTGNYTAVPFTADVGTYYAKIDLSGLVLENYNPYAYKTSIIDETGNTTKYDYSFTFNIKAVNAEINVESMLVAERSIISDSMQMLKTYFDLNIDDMFIYETDDRNEFNDAETILKLFSQRVLYRKYFDDRGVVLDYKLSREYLDSECNFVKNESGTNTGLYKIILNENDFVNFNIKLKSYNTLEKKSYVKYYYDIWKAKYETGTTSNPVIKALQNPTSYENDTYMIILPSYIDIKVGNGEIDYLKESYTHKMHKDWRLNAYYSTDGVKYKEFNSVAIGFSAINNDIRLAALPYLAAGEYTATISYTYFTENNDRNYIYFGDTTLLSNLDVGMVINYIFNGIEENTNTNGVKFKKDFTYNVTPIEISVEIEPTTKEFDEKTNVNMQYNGIDKPFIVRITDGLIYGDTGVYDTFNFGFDMEILYNTQTVIVEQKDVEMSPYWYYFKGVNENAYKKSALISSVSDGVGRMLNAGEYKINIVSTGNINYVLKSEKGCEFSVIPIDIPIYITRITEADGLTIKSSFTAKTINPIDSLWKKEPDTTKYYTYASTTCQIVKEYYTQPIISDEYKIKSDLSKSPDDIIVYSYDESTGDYPINVKMLPDGSIGGYPIEFEITSSFSNYTVAFVYRDSKGNFIKCDKDHAYKLVIEPREVYLYNFAQINTKTYDGNAVTNISEKSRERLFTRNEITEAPVDISKIEFTFTRLDTEASTYLKYGNTKYQVIASNDLKSAGTLLVKAFFNSNYRITFKDGKYEADNNYGVFNIRRATVTLSLNDSTGAKLFKEYDSYGLTQYNNQSYTGYFTNISDAGCVSGVGPISTDIAKISYKLELKHYNQNYNITDIKDASPTGKSHLANIANVQQPYNIGYYWYNLRGTFEHYYDADGNLIPMNNHITYATADGKYTNWLSWNYMFTINEGTAQNVLNGCSGIYEIRQRNLYFIANANENNGIVDIVDENGKIVENLPTKITQVIEDNVYVEKIIPTTDYIYYLTYRGDVYSASDLQTAINSDSYLNYGMYIFQNNKFYNINQYNSVGNVGLACRSDANNTYNGNYLKSNLLFTDNGTNLEDSNSMAIQINFQNAINNNPNFTIVNSKSSVKIKPFTVKVNLTIVNTELDESETNKSKITYSEDLNNNALQYVFDPISPTNDENMYTDVTDKNLWTKTSIINQIIHPINANQISSSAIIFVGPDGEEVKDIEGKLYFRNGQAWCTTGGNKFEVIPAGNYTVTGTNISMNPYKYNIEIVPSTFTVEKKNLVVSGIERTYFDKERLNYTFNMTEEGETISEKDSQTAIKKLFQSVKYYIQDNTNVDDVVGIFDEIDNNEYYVQISKSNFVSDDPNYTIDYVEYSCSKFTNASYAYIPLTINKRDITINLNVGEEVQYGDRISSDTGFTIDYGGFPEFNDAYIYTYTNYLDLENADSDEYQYDTGIALRNELTDYIRTYVIVRDAIVSHIATSAVSSTSYRVEIKDSAFISEHPIFDNYNIIWNTLNYVIVKKVIDLNMNVNAPYYTINSVPSKNYFSARWTERDTLYYDSINTQDRLSYTISISEFTVNGKIYSDLESQLQIALSSRLIDYRYTLTNDDKKDDNKTYYLFDLVTKPTYADFMKGIYYIKSGQMYSKATSYLSGEQYYTKSIATTFANMSILNEEKVYYKYGQTQTDSVEEYLYNALNYQIMKNATTEELATSAGLRYVKLMPLQSQNFEFNCKRTYFMLYPEVNSIGNQILSSGERVNILEDAEAVVADITIRKDTKEIQGLSMFVQLNYVGMPESNTVQYLDVIDNTYLLDYYSGMNYSRNNTKVYYVSGAQTDASGEYVLHDGDIIEVYFVFSEIFYMNNDEQYINEIKSNHFNIILRKRGSETGGYLENIADKSNMQLGDNLDKDNFDEYLTYKSGTLKVNYKPIANGNTVPVEFKENYDVISLRAKMNGTYIDSLAQSFEITLYKNEIGNLKLGFISGSTPKYYVRMEYVDYFVKANTRVDNCKYYTFTNVNVSEGTVLGENYFVKKGNSFKIATGMVVQRHEDYYIGNEQVSYTDGCYVNVSETNISKELINIFDGRNHVFNIYLDKIGTLSNLSRSSVEGIFDLGYKYTQYSYDIVSGSRVYYVYLVIDGITYVFEYMGEPFVSGETYNHTIEKHFEPIKIDNLSDKDYYTFAQISLTSETYKPNKYYFKNGNNFYFYNLTYDDTLIYYERITNPLIYVFDSVNSKYIAVAIDNLTTNTDYYVFGEILLNENDYVENKYFIKSGDDFILSTGSYDPNLKYYSNNGIYQENIYLDEETHKYINDVPQFFTNKGMVSISYNNVYMTISKFYIKNRLLSTASINRKNYIANVVFWPPVIDSDNYTYILNDRTTETLAEGVAKIYSTVGFIVLNNNSTNVGAFNEIVNIETNVARISFEPIIRDNNKLYNNIDEIINPGLYTISYNAKYYLGNGYVTIESDEIKLLVVDGKIESGLEFKEYVGELGNKLEAVENGVYNIGNGAEQLIINSTKEKHYYFTNEMDNDESSITYIFDDMEFSNGSEMWIYGKTTSPELRDMMFADKEVTEGHGIGIRIACAKNSTTGETKFYTELHATIFSNEYSGGYINWFKSTTDIIWEGCMNIIKMDFVKAENDSLISVRLYQINKNTGGSVLAWQEYIRAGTRFKDISAEAIYEILGGENKNVKNYIGFGANKVSFKVIDVYKGAVANTNLDMVKYSADNKEITSGTQGIYTPIDSTIGGDTSSIYMFTDAYNVPYNYAGNSVSIKFKLGTNDNDVYGANSGFDFYFGSSTPYYLDDDLDVETAHRQRGMYIRYGAYGNNLLFAFYKYQNSYLQQTLEIASLGVNLADGNTHTITAVVDMNILYDSQNPNHVAEFETHAGDSAETSKAKSEKMSIAKALGKFYKVYIYIDDNAKYEVAIAPYNNDLSRVSVIYGGNVGIMPDNENGDKYFFKGSSYMGLRFLDDRTTMSVMNCVGYNSVTQNED